MRSKESNTSTQLYEGEEILTSEELTDSLAQCFLSVFSQEGENIELATALDLLKVQLEPTSHSIPILGVVRDQNQEVKAFTSGLIIDSNHGEEEILRTLLPTYYLGELLGEEQTTQAVASFWHNFSPLLASHNEFLFILDVGSKTKGDRDWYQTGVIVPQFAMDRGINIFAGITTTSKPIYKFLKRQKLIAIEHQINTSDILVGSTGLAEITSMFNKFIRP